MDTTSPKSLQRELPAIVRSTDHQSAREIGPRPMSPPPGRPWLGRAVGAALVLAATAGLGTGCVEEWECADGYEWEDPDDPDNTNCAKKHRNADEQADGGHAGDNGSSSGGPAGAAPGGKCLCDSDCQPVDGHGGICVSGLCMAQPGAPCSEAGSTAECPAGMRCWGIKGEQGELCWPDCAAYDCQGVCDESGNCAPAVGMECTFGCASYCPCQPGDCADGLTCKNGKCVEPCQPKCAGKSCGSDGCGGTCGTCQDGEDCVSGKCESPCSLTCFCNAQVKAWSVSLSCGEGKPDCSKKNNPFGELFELKCTYPNGKSYKCYPALCPNKQCSPEGLEAIDAANSTGIAANVMLGAGALAAAAGGGLLLYAALTAGSPPPGEPGRAGGRRFVAVVPVLAPPSAAVVAWGCF
ncbi:MAG: hypothetical protein HY744_08765 [Deltaproteobacteria bacterium]|nr:hypothetical protein [Deltaproteobacteria bacterium]